MRQIQLITYIYVYLYYVYYIYICIKYIFDQLRAMPTHLLSVCSCLWIRWQISVVGKEII